jgi:hypothetical protein
MTVTHASALHAADHMSETTLQPLAGVGIDDVTLKVLIFPHERYLQFAYDDDTTPIDKADVLTCHPGSVIHFISNMLRPQTIPAGVQDWSRAPQVVTEQHSEASKSPPSSMLGRSSSLLLSVLIILGVVALVIGLFFGRYRMHRAAAAMASGGTNQGSNATAAQPQSNVADGITAEIIRLYIARNDMNGSMMRGKSPPEQPTIIPYTDPKVGLESCCRSLQHSTSSMHVRL